MEKKEDLMLNDIWSFYFHDPYDENWTYPSYKKIGDISSVEEFWALQKLLKNKIHCGMFFLMREYVFPCWDDENNLKGGCFSLKVLKQDMPQFWQDICIKILGETFLKEEYNQKNLWSLINGVSTSPKKHFSIIRVWVKSAELSDPNIFNFPNLYQGDVFFKSNQQKIDENYSKVSGKNEEKEKEND